MKERRDLCLVLIGALKLLKAAALIAAGVGALKLVHRDVRATLEAWLAVIRVAPQGRVIGSLLESVSGLDAPKLAAIGVGSFAYAAVFLVEGVGLILRKRWAEYLTLFVTLSFIPFEVYEAARHLTALKVGALVLNLAVVAYLWVRIRGERHEEKTAREGEWSRPSAP